MKLSCFQNIKFNIRSKINKFKLYVIEFLVQNDKKKMTRRMKEQKRRSGVF